MYWPSVQEESVLVTPVLQTAVCLAPRLFGRSQMADMKGLQADTSVPLARPLSALQPITEAVSEHVQRAAAAVRQSALFASAAQQMTSRLGQRHEQPACTR